MRENTRAWRARELLKNNAPAPALDAYRRWVSPRLTNQRDHVQFASWARTGRRLREQFGTPRVSFEADGIWISDTAGLEWRYEPDSWMSALGKELGWEHEQGELQTILAAVKPGGAYVDVGAHVGGFAIPVARSHPDVAVHAFEPVPRTRTWLEANLARNGVSDRVTIWSNAVGAESRRGRMTGVDGVANHLAETGKAGPGAVDVDIETLDDLLLERVERVDVIKCDIEGGEYPAMRGAERLLRRDHPDLVLEIDRRFTPRFGYEPSELFDFLTDIGYQWHWFDGDKLRPGVEIEQALSATNNFLFTRS
jgi:FkbM family methyltransferase